MTIRNYRSHQETVVRLDDLTILIGANGTGKSAVLYALDWLFNGNLPSRTDLCIFSADAANPATRIEVEVEFGDLTSRDRTILEKYGRKEVARFRRSWSEEAGDKIIGDSLQGPGFSNLRKLAASGSAAELRAAYNDTCERVHGLPAYQSKAAATQALDAWESDPNNQGSLVSVDEADASHLFGFAGQGILRNCFQMILVPASADLASEVGEAGKGSVLSQVIGALVADVVRSVRSEWEEANRENIEQLHESIAKAVSESTRLHGERISSHLRELVPEASVLIRGESPPWSLRGEPTVFADVEVDGHQISLDRQGHGIQRAVMISALQSLAVELPSDTSGELEGESDEAAMDRRSIDSERATVLLALEEPEIYQHPIRARHFGRVLADISSRSAIQVILATHSPYLISPDRFSDLRRFEKLGDAIRVHATTAQEAASAAGLDLGRMQSAVMRELKGEFSEAFFADLVVLVEGETDRAVVESLAERLGEPLDRHGIAVLDVGGKLNLRTSWNILRRLDIPCYVVFDEDEPGNVETCALVDLLTQDHDSRGTNYRTFHRDLEDELGRWSSVSERLDGNRRKNAYCYRQAILNANDETPARFVDLISEIIASRR